MQAASKSVAESLDALRSEYEGRLSQLESQLKSQKEKHQQLMIKLKSKVVKLAKAERSTRSKSSRTIDELQAQLKQAQISLLMAHKENKERENVCKEESQELLEITAQVNQLNKQALVQNNKMKLVNDLMENAQSLLRVEQREKDRVKSELISERAAYVRIEMSLFPCCV